MQERHRISVELSSEEYEKLHSLKYSVRGTETCTHAGIMRDALRLLFDSHTAVQEGDVVGTASGKGQRLKKVLVRSKGSYSDDIALERL